MEIRCGLPDKENKLIERENKSFDTI